MSQLRLGINFYRYVFCLGLFSLSFGFESYAEDAKKVDEIEPPGVTSGSVFDLSTAASTSSIKQPENKEEEIITATWLEKPRPILDPADKLQDENARTITLGLSEKATLLFFGFTRCSHTCPMSMQKIKAALTTLSPEEKSKFRVLFFTIDPANDKTSVLKKYLKPYGEGFAGALASSQVQEKATKNLAAFTSKIGNDFTHTDLLYFINSKSEWMGFT